MGWGGVGWGWGIGRVVLIADCLILPNVQACVQVKRRNCHGLNMAVKMTLAAVKNQHIEGRTTCNKYILEHSNYKAHPHQKYLPPVK